MIAILLAAGAAIGWGASDFFGGDASRRDTPVFVVVAVTELLGTLAVVPLLAASGTPLPDSPRLLFAVLAGLATTCELGLIYRALSLGDAFITAPIGALGAAIAVSAGLLTGDSLSVIMVAGLALALLGGGASAWTAPGTRRPGSSRWRIAGTCAAAAAAIATALIALHAAGPLGPYWVAGVEHLSTAASAGVVALASTRGPRPCSPGRVPDVPILPSLANAGGSRPRLADHRFPALPALPSLAGARAPRPRAPRPRSLGRRLPRLPSLAELPKLGLIALAGTGGDLAYITASVGGALSIVSAVSSLYPVTTIALSRVLQGQRATRVQAAGIALALVGAALLGLTTH
jgi:drug/metabolite transporter (DMT)-like permease